MTEKKPFHVSGLEPTKMKVLGVNIFPLIVKMTGLMSDETRKNQVTKKVAQNYLSLTFPLNVKQLEVVPSGIGASESQGEPERENSR